MSNDGKIIIDTKLDTSGFEKDVDTASKKVANDLGKGTEKAMKQAENSIKNVGKAVNSIDFSKVAKQMDSISKSIENTNAKIELQKNKLENLKKSFDKATDVNKKNKIQEQMLNTEASIIKLESKLDSLNNKKITLESAKSSVNGLDGSFKSASVSINNSLDKIETKSKKTGKEIENSFVSAGDKISKIGDKISNAGDTITRNVTLPAVGLGIAIGKIGMDFDSQMSRVKAISGATGEEFTKLKDQAIDLGASTAFSAKESAEGMENLASAGFSTNEIMSAMSGMLDLAASSGEGLASSADIAASTLRGFGLEASQAGHVADVLAKNAGKTNAAVADTGEAMKYIAPVAHSMGLSLEEVTAAIGIMANAGIKGSQSGTTLRSALTRLASPAKEAKDAMAAIGFQAFDSQGKMLPLKNIIDNLTKSLKGKTDQQKQDYIATIFGQEAMSGMVSLIDTGSSQLDELTNSYKNSDGAAQDMAKTMQDNAKSAVEQMFGSMETAAIKIEENFAPMITELANNIGQLADEFGELTPEQQEFYVKLVAGAAAAGPLLKTVGGLTNGIGGIVKVLSRLAPAAAGATGAIGGIAEAGTVGAGAVTTLGASLGGAIATIAPFLIAAAAIGTVGYGIYESMNQEVVPSVDLFADEIKYASETVQTEHGAMQKVVATEMTKISDSTKQAVQSYLDMDNDAKSYLQDLYVNNTTITDAIVNDSKTKFDSMANNTISGYEKQKNEGISKLNELFSKEKSLTEEEQADILKRTSDYYSNKETKVKEDEDRINKIISDARSNNRSLTKDELNEIQNLQDDMRNNAINALSKQESEAAVILQRMKDYDGRITSEAASEKIKALNDSRDKAIQAANDEYDQKIAIITDMRDNVGSITEDEADKMIEAAKRQRDETVTKAEETRDNAVDKIQEMNSNISNSVDTTTGDILTNWDKLKNWWNSWAPQPKTTTITTKTEAINVNTTNAMNSQPWAQNNPYLQIGSNYTGTSGGSEGLTYGNEHGWEISTGEEAIYLMGSGSGIKDHMSSVNEMKQDVANAVDSRFGVVIQKLVNAISVQSNLLGQVANNTGETVKDGQRAIELDEKLANDLVNNMNSNTGTFSTLQNQIDNAKYDVDKANLLSIEDNPMYIEAKNALDAINDMTEDAKKKLGDEEYKRQKESAEKQLDIAKKTAELDITIAKQAAEEKKKIAEQNKDNLIKISEAVTTAIKNQLEEQKAAAEKVHQDRLKQLEEEYDKEISNIDKVTNRKIAAIDKQLKALEEETTETSRDEERQADQDNIDVLTAKMNNTASESDKRAYELQIENAKKELEQKENEWNIEDERAALEEEKALLAEKAQAKKEKLEEEYEDQKTSEEAKLKATDEYYDKLLETDSLNSQARYTMLTASNDELVVLLNSYAPNWQDAGQSLADSLLTGLNSNKQSVQDAISQMIALRGSTTSSNSSSSGYASGTVYNPYSGFYKVDEEGFEISSGDSVAYVGQGAAIKNHMQSEQFIKSEIARQVTAMKASVLEQQANMQSLLVGSLSRSTDNNIIKNEHNQNAPLFHAEHVYFRNEDDIEQMAYKLGFYSVRNRPS